VTEFAICDRQTALDILGILRVGVQAARAVARLAPGVLEMRSLGFGYKPSGLAIARGVADKTFLEFGLGQTLAHLGDALK
jgi:hypothetical protein